MKRYLFGVILAAVLVLAFGNSVSAQAPTITPGSIPTTCAGVYTTLPYTATNSPTTYSITWAGSPVGLPNVPAGTTLPLTSIPIIVNSTVATGSYSGTITVTNTSGSSAPMPITVSVNGLPASLAVSGGGGYCAGGAGVHIGMTSTEGGVTYQLHRGGGPVGVPVWGTGSSIDFGLQTIAGVYTVVASNAVSGCSRTMGGSAVVSVHAYPAVVAMTGGGGYCDGGTGVPVGLAGSAFGVNYQLYRGGIPVGSPVPGVGLSLDFGPQTISGTYTAVAIDTLSPFCPANMSGSVSVIAYPAPPIHNMTGGGDYCDGGYGLHVGLSNSNTSVNYKLFRNGTYVTSVVGTGAALDFGLFTPAGAYTATAATLVYGCAATMADTAVIGLIPFVVPSVSVAASKGLTICSGVVDSFSAVTVHSGPSPSFTWNINGAYAGTGPSLVYTPSNLDYVSVTMVSDAECATVTVLSDGEFVNVKDKIIPTVVVNAYPGLNIINGTTETLTAILVNKGVTPTFQWYVNGVLVAGATNSTFVSNAFHDKDSVSCSVYGCSDTAGSGYVIIRVIPRAGVDELTSGNGDIRVVPNPSNGMFTINDASGVFAADNEVTVKITDVVGKVIYTDHISVVNGKLNANVQLPGAVCKGMYLLNLSSQSKNVTAKVLVD